MRYLWVAAALLCADMAAAADGPDAAALFGARTMHWGVALSPEARQIAYLTAAPTGTAVMVADVETGIVKQAVPPIADGRPRGCEWKSEKRLICIYGGIRHKYGERGGFSRILSIDVASMRLQAMGLLRKDDPYGGSVLGLLPDDPSAILMSYNGLVARVDVETGKPIETVERAAYLAQDFAADAQGAVRFRTLGGGLSKTGFIADRISYAVRPRGQKLWKTIERTALSDNRSTDFEGFDESGDNLLALKLLDGRRALYRVSADGTDVSTLLFAHPAVDVSGVLRLGKYDRPVAAVYAVDATEYEYFDPALHKLSTALSKALPGKPTVDIFGESWDGKRKLVFAGRNGDPGRYYLYKSDSHELNELIQQRPNLAGAELATVTAISYPAKDGTRIPAYLTLPRGADPRGMPTIVMPHGGPAARDELGFDWLAQFWASQGYAVLQPNFRGSSGYGEAWYAKNGFQSWPTAIGDIDDGARWMIAQGKSDPKRMAIFGWSYGGYAALQAGVTDPGLYRAIVAVAPVTDLIAMKEAARRYVNFPLVDKFLGSGPHLLSGSPARNATRMTVPVLMFHGDRDVNVDISQSQLMDKALKAAGKASELVVYPALDHQLDDGDVRAGMLRKSAAFMAANMGTKP